MIVRFVGKVTHIGMFDGLFISISCLYRVYVTYLSLSWIWCCSPPTSPLLCCLLLPLEWGGNVLACPTLHKVGRVCYSVQSVVAYRSIGYSCGSSYSSNSQSIRYSNSLTCIALNRRQYRQVVRTNVNPFWVERDVKIIDPVATSSCRLFHVTGDRDDRTDLETSGGNIAEQVDIIIGDPTHDLGRSFSICNPVISSLTQNQVRFIPHGGTTRD